MSDIVLTVEGLAKKYTIGEHRERYVALRDVLARGARNIGSSVLGMGRQLFHLNQNLPADPPTSDRRPPTPDLRPLSSDLRPLSSQDFWALRDVSFEVKRGEVLGIIGRNGAGKSTLLKILSRITEPTKGRVRIRGRVASLLEVGTGFHPELTARENIFLNGAILGMTRQEIRRKFDEIVAFAEVEKFIDTPVKHYSSGMYVRLAFAVAAHLEPEILLVDEVLAVGDAEFQKKCLGKMGDVAKEGRTVLFVSHNMNAVERLCRRVLHLERGWLVGLHDDVRRGIMAYLNDVACPTASMWRNNGQECRNDYFRPEWFEVTSEAPEAFAGEPFSNQHPIVVTVAGEIQQADPALNIGLGVYREDGELLFWTFTTDAPESCWPKLAQGYVKLSVRLPCRWLNEGTYRMELLASLHWRAWLLESGKNAPSVTFAIQGGLSDSPLWDRKRPGALAPVLEWERI